MLFYIKNDFERRLEQSIQLNTQYIVTETNDLTNIINPPNKDVF